MSRQKLAGALALLLLAGCGGSQGQLTIRSTATPISAVAKGVTARVAEARGQLALGNVALALEGFKVAQRDDPTSAEAVAGIAECYDRMGRSDLAGRYYEEALALAPRSPVLLTALAKSFDLQGKSDEAAHVRAEVVAQLPAAKATVAEIRVEPSPIVAPRTASVTVKLPAPKPAAAEPIAKVAEAPAPRLPETSAPAEAGPRLERLSLAEVALVTQPRRWRSEVIGQTASSVTLRFVPLRMANKAPRVRLLNSARKEGLAARTRSALLKLGWANVSIGDSPRVRQKSLVLYSAGTELAARRLAKQLRIGLARDPRPGHVTVLLGRDVIAADRRS